MQVRSTTGQTSLINTHSWSFLLFLRSQNMLKNIISKALDSCTHTYTHRWLSWVTLTHPCSTVELWTAEYRQLDSQPPFDRGNGNYSKISSKRHGVICHKLTPRNHLQTRMYLLCDTDNDTTHWISWQSQMTSAVLYILHVHAGSRMAPVSTAL